MKGWQWYGVKGLQVCPYMQGSPVFTDGMLPFLYVRLKEEGRLEATFCGEHKTMDEFVCYFHRIKVLQVLCTVGVPEDPNRITPVGFSWVDNPRGVDGCRVAMPGEAFFKGSEKVSRDLCRLALAYAMHDLKIDVLHGVQTVNNYAARNIAIRLGFKEACVVPKYHIINGKFEDARVMILEAKEFLPRFFAWKEARDLADREQNQVEMSVAIA